MRNTFLSYLLLSTLTLLVAISAKYIDGAEAVNAYRLIYDYFANILDIAQFAFIQAPNPQDYDGPWGEGVKCPFQNPPAPNGTTVYTGSVPPAMTTDAVNYLKDANFKMWQVSEIKTYPNLTNLYFVMRKEFHSWHYSGGKVLTGCWRGVTVYRYINHP